MTEKLISVQRLYLFYNKNVKKVHKDRGHSLSVNFTVRKLLSFVHCHLKSCNKRGNKNHIFCASFFKEGEKK